VPGDLRTFAFIERDHAGYGINDGAAAVRMVRRAGTVSVDIETAGLGNDQWDCRAVTIGTSDEVHVLDPVTQRAAITDALAAATTLVFYNSPFDVPVLTSLGHMRLCDVDKVHDTLIDARLAAPSDHGGHSLGEASVKHLGIDYSRFKRQAQTTWREVTRRTKAEMFKMSGLDSEAYVLYAAGDVLITQRLYEAMPAVLARVVADHPFKHTGDWRALREREQVVNRMLLRRSCLGITTDFEVVDEIRGELLARAADADAVLASHGIDTGLSPVKVKEAAVDALERLGQLGERHRRLANGRPAADKNALARINHPIVDALTTRSQAHGFDDRYLHSVEAHSFNGRVHPQVAVCIARTGRMSYGSPAIQQFPPGVRRMLRFDRPATSMDWASIEPCIIANAAGETALIEHFERGGDIYEPVARAAGVDRKTAKVVFLAQCYGQGPTELGVRLGRSYDEARELIDIVMRPLTQIRKAIRALRNIGDKHGKVQTISRRVLPIDLDIRTGNHTFLGYKGANYWTQGSAYDVLAEALLAIHRAGLDDAVFAALHDELVVDTTASDDVLQIMTCPPDALVEAAGRVPVLRVERLHLGHNWADKPSS
jgi:DNA polymerase I-like protein with 3'-5' exonuclease and polymerase domains